MSFRASIREKYELWRAEMLAAPEPAGHERLTCPHCGDEVTIRWARNSDKAMVYHSLTRLWCPHSGTAWYGATRAEAVENFRSEGTLVNGSQPAGAATFQGWEFSAYGLSTEDVNALLQINSEPTK